MKISSARWAWIISTVAGVGAAMVLAFVLSFSSQGGGFYERHFVWLFWLNVAVAALLALVIVVAALRLVIRSRRGKFGSRLLIKLAGIFALVGLLPGLVIYTVSYQFVSRSIEAWFDERVAGALDSGLNLGKETLEAVRTDITEKTRLAAQNLGDAGMTGAGTTGAGTAGAGLTGTGLTGAGTMGAATNPLTLERLRTQLGALEVSLVGPQGQTISMAAAGVSAAPPQRPPAALFQQTRQRGYASLLDGVDEEALAPGGAGAVVRVLARVSELAIELAISEPRYLYVVQPVPRSMAANALAVQAAYSEYQQRALARDSLRRMYIGTLTLALILAVFAAVLLAIVLGNQLAKPLLLLADGVRQVAAGDLRAKPVFASNDELGGLTRSFAEMTAQVADARSQVQRGVGLLEAARTRLQTILDTLTAGVIVFDREGRIDTVNPGATRILQLPLSAWHGRRLSELPELNALSRKVEQRFDLLATAPEAGERDQWQESFELPRPSGSQLTLLIRGATLPGGARLMVFDDITEVVSAQRSEAWSEVARRLAHEIKNPLTPIQLSAERLQMKLQPKLQGADQALLLRSVDTIVNQVQAMLRLVNEFRDYARLPAAQLKALDLNALATEVLGLYGQALDSALLVPVLESGLPTVMGDATQLRQVIHNLVQNALDAVVDKADARVELHTSSARGDHGEVLAVRLSLLDNGPGFSAAVLKRAFEPYVTTKSKGTGLGLAVVKKIADEHGARLRVSNRYADDAAGAAESGAESNPVIGARVSLSFSNVASSQQATHATSSPPDAMTPTTTLIQG